MADANLLIPIIQKWEGGFVNDPADAGGATNKGVTIATFRRFYGKNATVTDLKNITDTQWLHIFKTGYWDKWRADEINNQSIANFLVDWVYNSGSYGITLPQKVLGVHIDGIVGPKTLAAINNYPDREELFNRLKSERIDFIDRIVINRPANKKFRKGWMNRINDFKFYP